MSNDNNVQNSLVVSSRLDIKTHDITSIAISEIEDSLHQRIASNTAVMRVRQEDLKVLETRITETLINAAKAHFETKAKAYLSVLKSFKATEHEDRLAKVVPAYTGSFKEDGKIGLRVIIRGAGSELQATNNVKISDITGLKVLLQQQEALKNEIAKISKETVEFKLKVGDISRLERKARAAAASAALSQTEEGAELLKQIKERVMSNDPSLKLLG